MTATDELRRLLEERGTEWSAFGDEYADQTLVHTERFGRCAVTEWLTGLDVHLFNLTPEQAVEATMGMGECRFVTVVDQDPSRRHRGNIAECDCCGYRCAIGFIQDERFRYCPNCGRKVDA